VAELANRSITSTEEEQNIHRKIFIDECRQKAWSAGCHAEISKQLDTLLADFTKLQDEDRKLEGEIKTLEALVVVIFECDSHLVEKVREVGREVVGQVGEAEALEGLGRCPADLGVVYETFKLKRLRLYTH
jgi:hypothetical protein